MFPVVGSEGLLKSLVDSPSTGNRMLDRRLRAQISPVDLGDGRNYISLECECAMGLTDIGVFELAFDI